MDKAETDIAFAGSIPEMYDRLMVPLIFDPYAVDITRRVVALAPRRVLEIAAGTGAVTRALARALPASVEIVATDLNPPMLARAAAVGTARPVTWQPADAMALPFDAGSFDLVVCQFGAMFFPDKGRAYAEVRRVLADGGHFVFNVWDTLATNDFARDVSEVLAGLYPSDPPTFMARTPHGYHDPATIAADLARGGFAQAPSIEYIAERSRADSARTAATAYCQGTPMRGEIESRAGPSLAQATAASEAALAERYGRGPVDAKIQALVVTVRR